MFFFAIFTVTTNGFVLLKHFCINIKHFFVANDVLLSHMITFLNDKENKELRGAFFDSIVGVAAYIGWHCSTILTPLLQQVLTNLHKCINTKTLLFAGYN